MMINKIEANGETIVIVESTEMVITDTQSALDFAMSINYETQSHRIALNKEAINEDFFILSTRLAGDVLQKFMTYKIKFCIYGDFSAYTSKPLKDFIYECNKGRDIFFVDDKEQAQQRLANA